MDPVSIALVTTAVIQGGLQIWGGSKASKAAKKQAEYQAAMYAMNARYANIAAQEAVRKGERVAGQVRQVESKVIGAQVAMMGAQGLDTSVGTPAALIEETRVNSELDQQTARNNAWREAWGLKIQAQGFNQQAYLATKAGAQAGDNALLTGYLGATNSALQAGYYYKQFNKTDPNATPTVEQSGPAITSTLNTQVPQGHTFDNWLRVGYQAV